MLAEPASKKYSQSCLKSWVETVTTSGILHISVACKLEYSSVFVRLEAATVKGCTVISTFLFCTVAHPGEGTDHICVTKMGSNESVVIDKSR